MKKPFAAYAGDDPYIFVCYAHDDEGLVYPEIQWLAEQGLNIWYDEGISPGSEWSEELGQAIENAANFLIFVTPNSVASRHCRNEVHFAQNRDAQVLAVHLAETELPAGLELALGASQGILAHQVSQTEYRGKMLRALDAQPIADERPSDPPAKTSGLKRKTFISLLLGVVTIFALWFGLDSDDENPEAIAGSTVPSIAVLPFANRSLSQENAEFLAEGIHDELLTQLGAIEALKVISRTSMLAYRGTNKKLSTIGDELGVTSILEGSVQRVGDTVRISARLINAYDENQLWADTYDRTLTPANLFAIQHEISMAIASALQTNLSPTIQQRLAIAPTQDLAALEAYFKGKQLLEIRTSESLLNAKEKFQEAIDRDPSFAHAYAGLAEAWLEIPNYTADVDPQAARQGASQSAQKATSLNGELPDALAVLGWLRLINEYDWQGAESALRKALAIAPGNVNALHWLSHVLSWQGKHAQAIELAERAAEIDPLSTLIGRNHAYINMDAGNYEFAVKKLKGVLARDPYSSGLENLWTTQLRAGYFKDAVGSFEVWAAARGRNLLVLKELTNLLLERERTGNAIDVPDALLEKLAFSYSDRAQIYAALGDREGTLSALERAYEIGTHSRSLLSLGINHTYDFLRADERFKSLLLKIGLAR